MQIQKRPYTKKELDNMLQDKGLIEAFVPLRLKEIVGTDEEGLIDALDDYVTNGYDLNIIKYVPYGVAEDGRIIMHVIGDRLNYIEEEED